MADEENIPTITKDQLQAFLANAPKDADGVPIVKRADFESFLKQATTPQAPTPPRVPSGLLGKIGIPDGWTADTHDIANPANIVPNLKNIAATGIEGASATLGGMVGAATGPFSAVGLPLGVAEGGELGRQINYGLGFQDEPQNSSAIGRIGRDAVLTGGLNALGKVAQFGYDKVRGMRGFSPNQEMTEYLASQEPGSLATPFNAPRTGLGKEGQIAEDLARHEPVIASSGVAAGIDANSPQAYSQFQGNIEAFKQQANATKQNIIRTVDQQLEPSITVDPSEFASTASSGPKAEAAKIAADKVSTDLHQLEPYKFSVHGSDVATSVQNNQVMTSVPKKLSLSDAENYIDQIDAEITQLKGFDKTVRSGAVVDPSKLAENENRLSALFQIRKNLSDKVAASADSVMPGAGDSIRQENAKISAMIEFGDLTGRFRTESLQSLTPGSGRSLIDSTKKATTLAGGTIDAALGSPLAAAQQARTRASTITRQQDAIAQFQRLVDFKNGVRPAPIPRDFDVLKSNPAALASFTSLLEQIDAATAARFPSLPWGAQTKIFAATTAQVPQAFQPPTSGYGSEVTINGQTKILNPMEQQEHAESIKQSNLPPSVEASMMNELRKGNYVPIPNQTSPQSQGFTPPDLGQMSQIFSSIPTPQSSGGGDAQILDQLRQAQVSRIDVARSGL